MHMQTDVKRGKEGGGGGGLTIDREGADSATVCLPCHLILG